MSDDDMVHICQVCESVFETEAELGGHCRVAHYHTPIEHVAIRRGDANDYMRALRRSKMEHPIGQQRRNFMDTTRPRPTYLNRRTSKF